MSSGKCAFSQRKIKFLGHTLDENGISADPDKVSAITEMAAPTNVSELRRFFKDGEQVFISADRA